MSKNRKSKTTILDIALLTAGRVDMFTKCVDALLPEILPDYRVHVHNNGHPSKEYEEVYKKLPGDSVIIRSNQPSGFPNGANTVIRSGNAPIVLFVTDDVFLRPGAITSLLSRMSDTSIGQCGLKLVFPEDSIDPIRPAGKVQHIGMASNIRGEMIHPLIGWSQDNPKCNIPREVLAVTGASFMIRRNVFNRVGGFDPAYGKGYFEDMDLSFKIRASGYRVFVETEAVATHVVGQTFKNQQEPVSFQQNAATFKIRWFSSTPWSEFEIW